MEIWITLIVIMLVLSGLAYRATRKAQDTRPMFVWGFNTMAPVALAYCYWGSGDFGHKALIIVFVGIYLLRMNIVLTRWYVNTAAAKLGGVIPEQQQPMLAVMMVNIFGWLYCLPFYWAADIQGPFGAMQWLAIIVYIIGTIYHFGSDYQKRRFKQNPNNRGKLLNTGFWGTSRHPNYFGDFLIFVSFGLLANHWIGLIAPLTNIGQYYGDAIPKSEKMSGERYGEQWENYKRKVKCFIPFVV
ncbi:DUF1295 domain-containing protein [Vibrio ruber]|uniref:3-oxo-5-alpha-steroid 4-dehydrogenase n=1 Tax=Vibrio ruber (strain DSM 16370 / JCM 11486 / BCRC 17186 / CECT 7878 / LMG 23124 / VR1) TaxID=1123498 RepID=A0A1R4LJA2_VIBR1|nr:DUF1295 domain-containing protein [Vibrio ruber]WNJ95176.1 DUF1295 domain-containing protein [Vibrio ruber]SJN56344.1 3-oxo-5-alpha-steroid 4-dehydrogenase [Vibrio ruber DSM 16370]